jgi:hypothetical protein
MLRAITNGGAVIHFLATQSAIFFSGGIFHGFLHSCTQYAYSLVFTSSPCRFSNLSLQAWRKKPVPPTGVSFLAVCERRNIDFFIQAFRADTTAIESNFCTDESNPFTTMIILLLLWCALFYFWRLFLYIALLTSLDRILHQSRVYQLLGCQNLYM